MNVSRRMEQKSAGTLTGKLLHQLSDLVKRPSYPQKLAVCFRDTVDPKPQPFGNLRPDGTLNMEEMEQPASKE